MPTRSASDFTAFQRVQAQAQLNPTLTRTTPYSEGGRTAINSLLQYSDMKYATTGQLPPNYVVARPIVQTRSNPQALSTVAFLGSSGVQAGTVSRPQPRTSGTSTWNVPLTNLIQHP
jgi:hypothetical protein